jgi:hypothetical protein
MTAEALAANAAMPASARIAAAQEERRALAAQRQLEAERPAAPPTAYDRTPTSSTTWPAQAPKTTLLTLAADQGSRLRAADFRMDRLGSAEPALQVAAFEPRSVSMTPVALKLRSAVREASLLDGSSAFQPAAQGGSRSVSMMRCGGASSPVRSPKHHTTTRPLGLSDPATE